MKKLSTLFAAVGLVGASVASTPALAEGWVTADLDQVRDRPECMRKAEATLDQYRGSFGGGHLGVATSMVALYDVNPDGDDVMIFCVLAGQNLAPLVIVHGENERNTIADRIIELW